MKEKNYNISILFTFNLLKNPSNKLRFCVTNQKVEKISYGVWFHKIKLIFVHLANGR